MREYQTTAVVDKELTEEQREMLRVRMLLGAFCEDWDDPEMSVYDDL